MSEPVKQDVDRNGDIRRWRAIALGTLATMGVGALLVATCTMAAWLIGRAGSNGTTADAKTLAEYQNQLQLPSEAYDLLKNADIFELLSLDPSKPGAGDNDFHGTRVIGKVIIRDVATRVRLLDALNDGIARSDGGSNCDDPHHGIHGVRDNHAVDLQICFLCGHVNIYYADKVGRYWQPRQQGDYRSTVGAPAKVFNEVLKQAGVPVPRER